MQVTRAMVAPARGDAVAERIAGLFAEASELATGLRRQMGEMMPAPTATLEPPQASVKRWNPPREVLD